MSEEHKYLLKQGNWCVEASCVHGKWCLVHYHKKAVWKRGLMVPYGTITELNGVHRCEICEEHAPADLLALRDWANA